MRAQSVWRKAGARRSSPTPGAIPCDVTIPKWHGGYRALASTMIRGSDVGGNSELSGS